MHFLTNDNVCEGKYTNVLLWDSWTIIQVTVDDCCVFVIFCSLLSLPSSILITSAQYVKTIWHVNFNQKHAMCSNDTMWFYIVQYILNIYYTLLLFSKVSWKFGSREKTLRECVVVKVCKKVCDRRPNCLFEMLYSYYAVVFCCSVFKRLS